MREYENHGDSDQPMQIQKEKKEFQPINAGQDQKMRQEITNDQYLVQKQRMDEYMKSVGLFRETKRENTRERLVRSAIIQNLGSERYAKIDALKIKKPGNPDSTEKVALHHSVGAKLMAEGQDVIEFNVALNDHKHQLMSEKGVQGILSSGKKSAWKKEEKVRWFNKNKFLTWTGLCKTKDKIERENRILRENKEAAGRKTTEEVLTEAYGTRYGEKVKGKTLNQLRHKESENKEAGTRKDRFNLIGPSDSGKYSIEDVEKYILELGQSVLKKRLSDWDWKEDEELKDFKKVTITLQGYDAGGVAVSLGAMRIKRWIADNYPRFLDKVNFQIIQYDPTSRMEGATGKKAEIDHDPVDEKLAKKDPRYMALGENADTTVVYSLHSGSGQEFKPQVVKGAKRVILTMGDHSVNLEKKDQSQGKDTRQTYFAEKDGKVEAFRASGLNELDEGIYIADDNNNLIRLRSLEEYDALAKTLIDTKKQSSRHEVIREVVGSWFGLNGDELTEGAKEKRKNDQQPEEPKAAEQKAEEKKEEKKEQKEQKDGKSVRQAAEGLVDDVFQSVVSELNKEKAAEKQEQADKEQKQFEKDVSQLFLGLASQIHDPNSKGSDEIWSRIGKLGENPNEESVTYRQLRAAAEKVKDLAEGMADLRGRLVDDPKKQVSAAELMDAMNRLSETANAYYDTHRGHQYTERGAERRKGCDLIRLMTEQFYNRMSKLMGGKPIPAITEKNTEKKIKASDGPKAKKRMEELAADYAKWKKHFALREGCERTSIRDRAALFDTFAEDIEVYKASYRIKDWPKEIEEAIKAANYYRFQNTVIMEFEKKTGQDLEDPLMKMTRTHAEEMDNRKAKDKKLSPEETDQGLKEDKVRAIEEIDRWFLRNYNNAGMAGRLVQIRNHHGEIVTKLLKKTKRERLFIYYLIETGKRKTPDVVAAFDAQMNYTPDLSKFKDQMLASKLKVMSRIFGDYVYMHKLADAMQINDDYQAVIRDAALLDQKEQSRNEIIDEEGKQEETPAGGPEEALKKADETRTGCLKELVDAVKEYRDDLEKKQKEGLKEPDEELVRLRKKADTALKALIKADNAVDEASRIGKIDPLGEKRPETLYNQKDTNKEDVPTHISLGGTALSSVSEFSHYAVNGGVAGFDMLKKGISMTGLVPYQPTTWRLRDGELANYQFYSGGNVATALTAAGDALSAFASAYYFAKNIDGMHAGDIGMNVASLLNSTAKMALDIGKGMETAKYFAKQAVDFDKNRVLEFSKPMQGLAIGVGAVTAGIGTYRTIAGGLDLMNTKNAAKLLAKKNEKLARKKWETTEEIKQREAKEKPEEREKRLLEERRAKFDKNMLKLSKKMNERKVKVAAVETIGAVSSTVGLVIPGIGTLSMVATVTAMALGATSLTKIRTMIFDEYFEFGKYLEKAKRAMKKRGQEIYNMDEFQLRMRRMLAASLGYADMFSACDHVVKRYADQVCQRLYGSASVRATDPEEIKGYIQLAKSFGLPVDLKKHKPSPEQLARKMNAK